MSRSRDPTRRQPASLFQRAVRIPKTPVAEPKGLGRATGLIDRFFVYRLEVLAGCVSTDSLAKILLTCVLEPGGEAMEAAVARAPGRHARLLKIVGQVMVGDSQLAMQDFVIRGEG